MLRRNRLDRLVQRLRRPVATALTLLLAGGSLPARGQVVGAARKQSSQTPWSYLSNGGNLYRTDAPDLPRTLAALGTAPGFASVTFERATSAGDPAEVGTFDLRAEDVLASFRPVGEAELAGLAAAGRASIWHEVLRVAWASDGHELTTTYTVEDDEISVVAPCDPRAPGARVALRVQGFEVELSSADLAADAVPANVITTIEGVFGRLQHRERVVNAVAGFAAALPVAIGRPVGDYTPVASKWACVNCAGLLAGYGVALGALITACGGPFAMPCVMAFLQLTVAKVAVIATCGQCIEWIEEERDKKKKGEKDKENCPCLGEPSCNCG